MYPVATGSGAPKKWDRVRWGESACYLRASDNWRDLPVLWLAARFAFYVDSRLHSIVSTHPPEYEMTTKKKMCSVSLSHHVPHPATGDWIRCLVPLLFARFVPPHCACTLNHPARIAIVLLG